MLLSRKQHRVFQEMGRIVGEGHPIHETDEFLKAVGPLNFFFREISLTEGWVDKLQEFVKEAEIKEKLLDDKWSKPRGSEIVEEMKIERVDGMQVLHFYIMSILSLSSNNSSCVKLGNCFMFIV